jgi:hypothetical protein
LAIFLNFPCTPGRRRTIEASVMTTYPLPIDRDAWRELDAEQRRLLRPTGLSIEEKLRRGQHLSAQAAALRRALVRDEQAGPRS